MRRAVAILTSNPLSLLGLILIGIILICAIFADFIAPFPEHRGAVVDFANFNQPPRWPHLMGTDLVGRDLFSRVIYAYRISLILGAVVLGIAVPVGVTVGLIAGYFGRYTEFALMRVTDVFLSIPPLVLAMSIMGVLEPHADQRDAGGDRDVVALVRQARLQHDAGREGGRLRARGRGDRRLAPARDVPRDSAELLPLHHHQDDARPRLHPS